MYRDRGNIVTRLMAGIAFGSLFLAGGFYIVGHYLTPDLMICQRLHFTIPESRQDLFSTHWAAFAEKQQEQLVSLAHNKIPYLVRYLSVIPQTDEPVIALRLRGPPDTDEDIHQKFNDLVAVYIGQRTAVEQSVPEASSKTSFSAQLSMPLNDIKKTKPFSRFQQFVLVMFAVAGFLLGVGPPGGYVQLNQEKPTETPREIRRMIQPATGELPVPYSSAIDTNIATEVVVAVPPQKVLAQSEESLFPVVQKITVDEAGIATEKDISEPEPEIESIETKDKLSLPGLTAELEPKLETEFESTPEPLTDVVKEENPAISETEEIVEESETIPLRPLPETSEPKKEDIIAAKPKEDSDTVAEKGVEDLPMETVEMEPTKPAIESETFSKDEPAKEPPAADTEKEEIKASDIQENQTENIASIPSEKEIVKEESAETMALEEEIEHHTLEQEVLLSEIVISKKQSEPEETDQKPAATEKRESIESSPEPEAVTIPKMESPPEPEPIKEEPQTLPPIEEETLSQLQSETEPVSKVSESEETKVPEEQETLPVVAIDLNKDMPSAGGSNAARSKYDTLADIAEQLRLQVRCPVIAVSALNPKDVSPRFTVNLAVTLIRRALRVLIVDADPSSKELATLFGLPEEPGFFEWRRGAAWISHTTHPTQLVGLSVMPAGIPNEQQKHPELELWREKHRWGNLAKDFDVVLLYYPSALTQEPHTLEQTMGVHMRDMCQGILALTRSTKQLEKSAQTTVDLLADHTAPLLAVIPIKA